MPVVCIGFYCIQPTIKFYTHGQQILATYAPVNTDWIIGLDWITGSQSLSLQKTMCSMQLPLLFLQFSFMSLKKKLKYRGCMFSDSIRSISSLKRDVFLPWVILPRFVFTLVFGTVESLEFAV